MNNIVLEEKVAVPRMVVVNGDEVMGQTVVVVCCEARRHGNYVGCVCGLIGVIVTVDSQHKTVSDGRPIYRVAGNCKTLRGTEVVLLK